MAISTCGIIKARLREERNEEQIDQTLSNLNSVLLPTEGRSTSQAHQPSISPDLIMQHRSSPCAVPVRRVRVAWIRVAHPFLESPTYEHNCYKQYAQGCLLWERIERETSLSPCRDVVPFWFNLVGSQHLFNALVELRLPMATQIAIRSTT